MRQDSIVVRNNPSLAFMLTLIAWNHIDAIFLQIGKLCQEERMDTIIFLKNKIINDINYMYSISSFKYVTIQVCGKC